MVIRDVTPNVTTMSVPFARVGTLRIGGRGTLVKMTSGKIAVFSPVALTPEVKAKVVQMGNQVAYIIAPDMEHHIFISEWAAEYPEAKVLGPDGLPEKRAKQKDPKITNVDFSTVFTAKGKLDQKVDPDFDADFIVEFMDAHPNKEVVLFFRPDRVLLEADLLFNLPANEQYSRVPEDQKKAYSYLNRLFVALNRTTGDLKTVRRFMWYAISSGNRKGFNESIARISAWDFVTIIPCHGEVIEENGKQVFDNVFEWHLQAKS